MPARIYVHRVFPLITASLLAWSCTSTPPVQGSLVNATWAKPDARAGVLKTQVREYAVHFGSSVARGSDEILASTKDRAIRRHALEWKMHGTALAQEAAFRPDALGALFDTWTLCTQMRQYFSEGEGKDQFGVHQSTAIEVMSRLEDDITGIAATVSKTDDVSALRQIVESAAARHPIRGGLYTRTSAVLDYAELGVEVDDLAEIASNINERVLDLYHLVRIQSAHLPDQARWQAELLVADDLETISGSVERIAVVVEQLPEVVEKERIAVTEFAREERSIVLASVDEQRRQTLDAITNERQAVLDAVTAEREAVLAAIDRQRIDTVGEVTKQRVEVIDALVKERVAVVDILGNRIEEAYPRIEELIDHFFVRLLEVAGVVAAAAIVLGGLGLFLRKVARRGSFP